MTYPLTIASTYGTGAYDSANYDGTNVSSSGSGTLSNTGLDIAVIVTIACIITLVALVVRIVKRKPTKPSVD